MVGKEFDNDEIFMVQYIKEEDKIFNVFYNDKNITSYWRENYARTFK